MLLCWTVCRVVVIPYEVVEGCECLCGNMDPPVTGEGRGVPARLQRADAAAAARGGSVVVRLRLRAQRHVRLASQIRCFVQAGPREVWVSVSWTILKHLLHARSVSTWVEVPSVCTSLPTRRSRTNLEQSGSRNRKYELQYRSKAQLSSVLIYKVFLICRCSLTALSINTALKRVPRIWGAASLPLDAFRLSATPNGGTLVLCQNLLLYHSQVRHTPCYWQ